MLLFLCLNKRTVKRLNRILCQSRIHLIKALSRQAH